MLRIKKGTLSITQRRGLISLLPKKHKVLHHLRNWRPISLLNCDYKIAAKVIASRINTVLPTIINFDQTGFLKGRSIGENIRLIDSIINFTKLKGISSVYFCLSTLRKLLTPWSGPLWSRL